MIEDDEDLRSTIEEMLAAEGFAVQTLADGTDAISLQRQEPFDLVVTDIFMPNRDGIETISDFRQEFPQTKIIAMSSATKFTKFNFFPALPRAGSEGGDQAVRCRAVPSGRARGASGSATAVSRPMPVQPTPAALLQLLWTELADVMGNAATATVLRRAAGRAAGQAPKLAQLTIERERFTYRYTVPPSWDTESETNMDSMRHLMRELRPLLYELTGPVVLRRLGQIPEFRRSGLASPQGSP